MDREPFAYVGNKTSVYVGGRFVATFWDEADAKFAVKEINAAFEARVKEDEKKAVEEFRARCVAAICIGCRNGWKISGKFHEWPNDGKVYVGLCRCDSAELRELPTEPEERKS
jgi:hypothetical protein